MFEGAFYYFENYILFWILAENILQKYFLEFEEKKHFFGILCYCKLGNGGSTNFFFPRIDISIL